MHTIWGLADGEAPGSFDVMVNIVHPDDREAYRSAWFGALEVGAEIDHEFRIVLPNGEIRNLHTQGKSLDLVGGRGRRYVGATMDVTEVRMVEQVLREARDQAQEASHAKSQFLANMSHELRTPMNAIIGFTRLVMRRSKEVLPQKQYENLEKILISSDHLLSLINDVLDLSKIEAGHIDIRPKAFALEPLVDFCVRTVEPMVKADTTALNRHVEAELPEIYADEERLKQILLNLLSNAAKFTDTGEIGVTVSRQDDQITIAVSDSGIGIPEDAQTQVFEEFHQVDGSATRQFGGTGFGLAISRRLARLMGGDIALESEFGKGSIFTLTLPIRYAGGASAEPSGEQNEGA